ncbi:hypothetical protein LEP3755_65700 (plasmid) [Leptolyngbya sp. NIES-3755]|nr:hypothetical protein LEP3755_65700 [Leptolyngbya sp. NIES-3755]
MTQAARKLSFEEYLNLESFEGLPEGRSEFINGALTELPPESEPNDWIARYLFLLLANTGIVSARLIAIHTCELQVPVLQSTDPRNRYPDLVILREEHLQLTQRRLTIKLDMPPPQLVAEVVSPGQTNRDRDYKDKLAQYQQRGIPEYWLIDPEQKAVIVLELRSGQYVETGTFEGKNLIRSSVLKNLPLSAEQILAGGR